jgi:hypothetical protein
VDPRGRRVADLLTGSGGSRWSLRHALQGGPHCLDSLIRCGGAGGDAHDIYRREPFGPQFIRPLHLVNTSAVRAARFGQAPGVVAVAPLPPPRSPRRPPPGAAPRAVAPWSAGRPCP